MIKTLDHIIVAVKQSEEAEKTIQNGILAE